MVVDCGCELIAGEVHAACVTVIVVPATVSEPLRAAPVLAATVKAVDPLPLPPVPEVIVIHGVVVDADHAQPVPLMTVTDPVPPAVSKVNDAGDAV